MPPPVLPPVHPSLLYAAGDLALYSALPPLIIFVVMYVARSNWRTTEAGRSIAYFAGTLLGTLLLAAITRLFGQDWPGREWVRMGAYLATSVAMWRLLVTLLRAQRKPARQPTKEEELGGWTSAQQ
jgi:hypothetical protein